LETGSNARLTDRLRRTPYEWLRIPFRDRSPKRRKIASSDNGRRMMDGDRRWKATALLRRSYQGTIEYNKPNGA
jgi:hypothetical protein